VGWSDVLEKCHDQARRKSETAAAAAPIENIDIAKVFGEVADLPEIQGENPFRVRAYRTAARTVETLGVPCASLAKNDPKALQRYPATLGATRRHRMRSDAAQSDAISLSLHDIDCGQVTPWLQNLFQGPGVVVHGTPRESPPPTEWAQPRAVWLDAAIRRLHRAGHID
jgi:Helix-hairpin-helix domain